MLVPVLAAGDGAGDGLVELGFAHTGGDEPHGLEGGNGGAA